MVNNLIRIIKDRYTHIDRMSKLLGHERALANRELNEALTGKRVVIGPKRELGTFINVCEEEKPAIIVQLGDLTFKRVPVDLILEVV